MKIGEAHIGQKVKIVKEGVITGIYDDGTIKMTNADQLGYTERARYVEPVSDPCQNLEAAKLKAFQEGKAEGEKAADRKIGSINKSCEYWRSECHLARRNSTYWREELEKLQKEALEDTAPVSKVAKIYIQISPEVLERILKERD